VFVIDSCASAELPLIRQFTSRISRSIRFSVFMLTIKLRFSLRELSCDQYVGHQLSSYWLCRKCLH